MWREPSGRCMRFLYQLFPFPYYFRMGRYMCRVGSNMWGEPSGGRLRFPHQSLTILSSVPYWSLHVQNRQQDVRGAGSGCLQFDYTFLKSWPFSWGGLPIQDQAMEEHILITNSHCKEQPSFFWFSWPNGFCQIFTNSWWLIIYVCFWWCVKGDPNKNICSCKNCRGHPCPDVAIKMTIRPAARYSGRKQLCTTWLLYTW